MFLFSLLVVGDSVISYDVANCFVCWVYSSFSFVWFWLIDSHQNRDRPVIISAETSCLASWNGSMVIYETENVMSRFDFLLWLMWNASILGDSFGLLSCFSVWPVVLRACFFSLFFHFASPCFAWVVADGSATRVSRKFCLPPFNINRRFSKSCMLFIN